MQACLDLEYCVPDKGLMREGLKNYLFCHSSVSIIKPKNVCHDHSNIQAKWLYHGESNNIVRCLIYYLICSDPSFRKLTVTDNFGCF